MYIYAVVQAFYGCQPLQNQAFILEDSRQKGELCIAWPQPTHQRDRDRKMQIAEWKNRHISLSFGSVLATIYKKAVAETAVTDARSE